MPRQARESSGIGIFWVHGSGFKINGLRLVKGSWLRVNDNLG